MDFEDELCYCFHVSKRKILNYIRVNRLRRASQVSECGGAGTGCGWCIPYLKRCFEEVQAGGIPVADRLTPEEYARLRARYIVAGGGVPPPGATPLPDDSPRTR